MANAEGRVLFVSADCTNTTLPVELQKRGYAVTVAATDIPTVDMARAQQSEVVLLHADIPTAQRYQLLGQLKGDSVLSQVPVILLSNDAEGIEHGLAAGAEDVLLPPFHAGLLAARIGAGIERYRIRTRDASHLETEMVVKLERDMQIARQIQAGFLPETLPQPAGWEIAARFHPAREVAGDFYDAFTLSQNRRVGFVIADVVDKGVGAALFMALCRSLIRAFAQQHYSLSWANVLVEEGAPVRAKGGPQGRRALPSIGTSALKSAMDLTNNYILTNHEKLNMFATLFFGVLDPETGSLVYVNGGHNPPYLVGPQGVKGKLKPTGPAVGMFPGVDYRIDQAQMEPGDALILYTDGVTEAKDPHGGFFTDARLVSLIEAPAPSATDYLERIETGLRQHMADAVQFDDITMMAIHWCG